MKDEKKPNIIYDYLGCGRWGCSIYGRQSCGFIGQLA